MSKFLPLDLIQRFVPLMEERGVSEVARSPQGFLTAYKRVRGRPYALSPAWLDKRLGFIARHMAQARNNDEPWFDARGLPTRRHLALIAWAYSPAPHRLSFLTFSIRQ